MSGPMLLRTSGLFLPRAFALAKADGFADSITQVVELGAASDAAPFDFDLGDSRGVKRKLSLDPLAGDDPPDRKHLAAAAARAADDRAAEDLDTLVLAFEDPGVNVDRVADGKLRQFALQAGLFDELENLVA